MGDYVIENEMLPSGSRIHNVYSRDGKEINILCQCSDPAVAQKILVSLEWYDSLNDGVVRGRPQIAAKAQDWDIEFTPPAKRPTPTKTRRKA